MTDACGETAMEHGGQAVNVIMGCRLSNTRAASEGLKIFSASGVVRITAVVSLLKTQQGYFQDHSRAAMRRLPSRFSEGIRKWTRSDFWLMRGWDCLVVKASLWLLEISETLRRMLLVSNAGQLELQTNTVRTCTDAPS
jgi:hypothetical protein